MELLTDVLNNQLNLYIPVALVIVGAILVFTFGFKSAEQPPFDKLTTDDRKPANKKRKIKEKKTNANGHITSGESKSDKSPTKETKRSPTKDAEHQKAKKSENVTKQTEKQPDKNKKNEAPKTKVIEEIKNKKNLKKTTTEKPVDFDDGNWETVPSKADKKKKQEQSPVKKDKKAKKVEKTADIDKEAKEIINKELQELITEKEVEVEKIIPEKVEVEELIQDEPAPVIEEKKEKKKEKKTKKEPEPKKPVEDEVVLPPPKEDPPKQEPPKEEEKEEEEVEQVSQPETKSEIKKETPPAKEGGVAFDELGDTWTEAKQPKKSKKKARRDN